MGFVLLSFLTLKVKIIYYTYRHDRAFGTRMMSPTTFLPILPGSLIILVNGACNHKGEVKMESFPYMNCRQSTLLQCMELTPFKFHVYMPQTMATTISRNDVGYWSVFFDDAAYCHIGQNFATLHVHLLRWTPGEQHHHVYLDIDVDVSAAGDAVRSAGPDNTRTKQQGWGANIFFTDTDQLEKNPDPVPDPTLNRNEEKNILCFR